MTVIVKKARSNLLRAFLLCSNEYVPVFVYLSEKREIFYDRQALWPGSFLTGYLFGERKISVSGHSDLSVCPSALSVHGDFHPLMRIQIFVDVSP